MTDSSSFWRIINDFEKIKHKAAILNSGKSVHSAVDPKGVLLVPKMCESTTVATDSKQPIETNKTGLRPYTKGSHSATINATYTMQAPIMNGKKLCCDKNEFLVDNGPGYVCTTCNTRVYSSGYNKSGEMCGVIFF